MNIKNSISPTNKTCLSYTDSEPAKQFPYWDETGRKRHSQIFDVEYFNLLFSHWHVI